MILWSEPPPRSAVLVARGSGLGLCVLVGVVATTVGNWDVTAVAAVLAAALAFDLWRDLRPREVVVAGPDLLVVRAHRRSTTVRRQDVVELRPGGRRNARLVVVRRDGEQVLLPRDVPVQRVQEWLQTEDPEATG